MESRQETFTTTTRLNEFSNRRLRRPFHAPKVQDFHLVWLDERTDEDNNDNDRRNSIIKLQQFINTVNIFTDVDECVDFITDNKEEKVLMIISEEFNQTIIPVIEEISQVISVYIFCNSKTQHEQWIQKSYKVKDIFIDIILMCEAVKKAVQDCDRNSVSIGFVKATDGVSNRSLNELDKSFMYTQLLKEILLTIDFQQHRIDMFIEYCRERFVDNSVQLDNIEKIHKEYDDHQPIWWYTSSYILYSMLNRALRLMEIDLVVKMGFFLRDLHKQIAQLHAEQYDKHHHHSGPFIVYRGQGLSQIDFDQLIKTKGGLMSFNNFLSTSLNRAVSFLFAESNQSTPDFIGVLFEITVNPSIPSSPFANIKNVSHFQEEEEILFSMHSIFRIEQIKQIGETNRLWQVDLTLTSDNDPELHALTKCMRDEIGGTTGWFRLGQLMIKLGRFEESEQLYEVLMKQAIDEDEKGNLCHMRGVISDAQGKYAEAVIFFEKSIKIREQPHPHHHSGLAASYNNIGGVYKNMGEYSKALSYYEKALAIGQKTYRPNYTNLASTYSNMGLVYKTMGEHSKALSYYEKDLEISQKTLPGNHPNLATSYNNIAGLYENTGEYSKALSYYVKSFQILEKILPANHLYLALSDHNIGSVYLKMGEYTTALTYYEKALDVGQKTFPGNHSVFGIFYNNIGGVYDRMGQYTKALSYFEKALEIRQETLSENHPDLVQSYKNIGGVYSDIEEYSKALSCYEKVLKIWQNTYPPDYSNLARCYNTIGGLYFHMCDYEKALSYFEKSIDMNQKTLPINYAELATSYVNIAGACARMNNYVEALSYLERALDIQQRSLSQDHPDLKRLIRWIEAIKKKL